jgi:cobalamin biosynthesis protein CbiG
VIDVPRPGGIALIAASEPGARLARGLRERFAEPDRVSLWAARPYLPGFEVYEGGLVELAGRLWPTHAAIIGVMASGIVVRAIAPHVDSKYEDPAVVVVDDAGRYAISLLSGHEGGANRLAEQIASETQGQAVVTTGSEARRRVSRERIRVLQDVLREPGFVEEITGVAAVCEPAAMLAGAQTQLLAPKLARDGVTVALARDICGSSAWDQADETT